MKKETTGNSPGGGGGGQIVIQGDSVSVTTFIEDGKKVTVKTINGVEVSREVEDLKDGAKGLNTSGGGGDDEKGGNDGDKEDEDDDSGSSSSTAAVLLSSSLVLFAGTIPVFVFYADLIF